MPNQYSGYDEHRLASQIKQALLREALNRRVITSQQFSQLMELQRGR
jgi:hypothetical protein